MHPHLPPRGVLSPALGSRTTPMAPFRVWPRCHTMALNYSQSPRTMPRCRQGQHHSFRPGFSARSLRGTSSAVLFGQAPPLPRSALTQGPWLLSVVPTDLNIANSQVDPHRKAGHGRGKNKRHSRANKQQCGKFTRLTFRRNRVAPRSNEVAHKP